MYIVPRIITLQEGLVRISFDRCAYFQVYMFRISYPQRYTVCETICTVYMHCGKDCTTNKNAIL